MPQPILLIEDNPDDVILTLRALWKNELQNQVVVAKDGAEAIELLKTKEEFWPALILLDLKLPKIDGIEVLRWIRANQHTSLLPVVVLTSSREEQDIHNSYVLGANSYIRKPVDYLEFMDAMHLIVQQWILLNQPPPAPGSHY